MALDLLQVILLCVEAVVLRDARVCSGTNDGKFVSQPFFLARTTRVALAYKPVKQPYFALNKTLALRSNKPPCSPRENQKLLVIKNRNDQLGSSWQSILPFIKKVRRLSPTLLRIV